MMPPACKSPTCYPVKNRCQCPNAWIEFLSKSAADRRSKGLPKWTIAQHSAAFEALKSSGGLALKNGMNNGRCKADPVKLCAWMVRRKMGHKDLHRGPVHAQRARSQRLITASILQQVTNTSEGTDRVRTFLTDCLNKDPRVIRNEDGRALKRRLSKYLNLAKHDTVIGRLIGYGRYGMVFEGKFRDGPAAVKIVCLSRSNAKMFDQEVEMHRRMRAALPGNVPQLFAAFKVNHYRRLAGVVVMGKIDRPMSNLIRQHATDGPFIRALAKQVKDMVDKLHTHHLVHGDLHLENMGYVMVNGSPRLMLIDFGRSYPGRERGRWTVDEYFVWRYSILTEIPWVRLFNDALHAIHFPPNALNARPRFGVDKVSQATDNTMLEHVFEMINTRINAPSLPEEVTAT